MEKPLVSIIVPCYNQGEFLAEALDSVKSQTYSNWECVIVDDGSTDNSKEIALSYCDVDKRFSYLWQENQGPSIARNNAIKNSHGDYILPLDGDDKIHEDYISSAVEIIKNRKDVKIVNCRVGLFGASSGEWNLPDFNKDVFLLQNQIVCTAMFRREDYNQTKGYNSNMREGLEDWDFWLSLLETGGEVYKIPHIYFFYRIKESSRNISSLQKDIYNKLLLTAVSNHPALYRKQYSALLEKNNKLQRVLLYYKNSSFWALFSWLLKIEQQWYNFKVYIFNLLHNNE
jgi:glycosyltransferase involved in cell wall biosynthesis